MINKHNSQTGNTIIINNVNPI